jgi:hypothetical protein
MQTIDGLNVNQLLVLSEGTLYPKGGYKVEIPSKYPKLVLDEVRNVLEFLQKIIFFIELLWSIDIGDKTSGL